MLKGLADRGSWVRRHQFSVDSSLPETPSASLRFGTSPSKLEEG
jgi:hypothetical protein